MKTMNDIGVGNGNMLVLIANVMLYAIYLAISTPFVAFVTITAGICNIAFVAFRWVVMVKDRRKAKRIETKPDDI